MNFKRYLLLAATVLFLCGCGTQVQNSIPPNVNSVYLPTFENETPEPGLQNLLTTETNEQLLAEGQVNLVQSREAANVVVRGVITDYKRIPLIYNDQDIVQLYKVRIEMSLKMLDADTGKVLKKFDEIFRETRYSDVNPPVETEFVAQKRVIRLLARDVVTTIVEGWPYLQL